MDMQTTTTAAPATYINPTPSTGRTNVWPAKICTRCSGGGQYSYNPKDGTVCYGCGGQGLQYLNNAVQAIRTEYAEALKVAQRPLAGAFEVGDKIAVYNGTRETEFDGDRGTLATERMSGRLPRNIEWATLTAIEIVDGTPEHHNGYSRSTNDGQTTTIYSGFVTLRYEFDGADHTVECSTGNLWIRNRPVDRQPFLDRAWAEAHKVATREAKKQAKAVRA